jgi:DNA-directed RNA polymerase subunit beta'
MNLNAALAHGAHEVIKDATLIRGVKNEDYWNALRAGRPLPEPDTPFIYDKFINTLKAGGINVDKKGDILTIMPMTNADIDKISSGEIKNSRTVDIKNQDAAPGGLFDNAVTGGANGNKWSHITLAEPVPNPVMEEPIRRVLGLKVKEFHDILAGKEELNGETGGKAIRKALGAIDVDKDIERYTQEIKTARGARRDNAVKALRYLHAARKQDINPTDWIIDKVPVIPPAFRPISQVGDMLKASDLNGLYRDVVETNNTIKDLRNDLPEDELADEKIALYKSVTAAFGLGQPITPDGTSKNWKGAIRQVIGNNPKTGMLQSKVLSKTVNFVGRAVASPNPNYDMDTVGIPENKAWTIYRPFIIRSLVRSGVPQARAAEMVEEQTREAKDALLEEMDKRPVIMDRAPTWHKFNLLAFKPKLVESDTIQVSPLIVSGFNMDFDGDAVNFHVPVSDKAVKQAWEKMTPSKNLFAVNDLKSPQHAISKEMAMGLYQLTRKAKAKPPVVFTSVQEAKKAYREGLIDANDPIEIRG